ncbi:MAG TPA: hypothetical protein VM778_06445, partial [Gemmatimonadota bacterium]|nr:hypothetical protein [Gemmatimonadota bacterium]
MDADPGALQPAENVGVRMAEPVPRPGRDDRVGRDHPGEEGRGRGVPAAVVAHVEDPGAQGVAERLHQPALSGAAQVPGQEQPAAAPRHEEDDRGLVLGHRAREGIRLHPLRRRMEDVDRHLSLAQPAPGAEDPGPGTAARPLGGQERQPRLGFGDRARAPPPLHPEPADDARRAAHVIQVRVGGDQPLERGHAPAPEVRQDHAPPGVAERVGSARIHQPGRAVRKVQNDRVALTDVEPHRFPAARLGGTRREQERDPRPRHQRGPAGPAADEPGGRRQRQGRTGAPPRRSRHPHGSAPGGEGHHGRGEGEGGGRRGGDRPRHDIQPHGVRGERHPDEREGERRDRHGHRVGGEPGRGDPAEGRRLDRECGQGRGGRGSQPRRDPTADPLRPAPGPPGSRLEPLPPRPAQGEETGDRQKREREAQVEEIEGPDPQEDRRRHSPRLPRRHAPFPGARPERRTRHDRGPDHRRPGADQGGVAGERRAGGRGPRAGPRARQAERHSQHAGEKAHVQAGHGEQVERSAGRKGVGQSGIEAAPVTQHERLHQPRRRGGEAPPDRIPEMAFGGSGERERGTASLQRADVLQRPPAGSRRETRGRPARSGGHPRGVGSEPPGQPPPLAGPWSRRRTPVE